MDTLFKYALRLVVAGGFSLAITVGLITPAQAATRGQACTAVFNTSKNSSSAMQAQLCTVWDNSNGYTIVTHRVRFWNWTSTARVVRIYVGATGVISGGCGKGDSERVNRFAFRLPAKSSQAVYTAANLVNPCTNRVIKEGGIARTSVWTDRGFASQRVYHRTPWVGFPKA